MSGARFSQFPVGIQEVLATAQEVFATLKDPSGIKEEKDLVPYTQEQGVKDYRENPSRYEENASKILDFFILNVPDILHAIIEEYYPKRGGYIRAPNAVRAHCNLFINPAARYFDDKTACVPFITCISLYNKMQWIEWLLIKLQEQLPNLPVFARLALLPAITKRLTATTQRLNEYAAAHNLGRVAVNDLLSEWKTRSKAASLVSEASASVLVEKEQALESAQNALSSGSSAMNEQSDDESSEYMDDHKAFEIAKAAALGALAIKDDPVSDESSDEEEVKFEDAREYVGPIPNVQANPSIDVISLDNSNHDEENKVDSRSVSQPVIFASIVLGSQALPASNHISASQSYRYTNDSFPCLVRHGAPLEDIEAASDRDEYYRINARNALRHLTYGQPLFKGSIFRWANLKLAWLNFKCLFLKRDKKLLQALRTEMQEILKNAYSAYQHCDPEAKKRLAIYINTLLSNLPFMDPEEGEEITIPQKIAKQWIKVRYKFTKIDLSPKSSWWNKILEDEDRLYAYGLEPVNNRQAHPYLLLMGTTYLSGQGSLLSLLGDLTPGQSVGERHELQDLEKWIKRQEHKVKIVGHSQGGSMAMIVAARYPAFTLQADCLNPTALHRDTLRRLQTVWNAHRGRNPDLNVYTQTGDPVLIFGDAFLPGTHIYHVDQPQAAKLSMLASHAQHFSGQQSARITEFIGYQQIKESNKKKFFNDMKVVADITLSPLLLMNLVYFACKKKIMRFFSQQLVAMALSLLLFTAALAACFALSMTGVLAPLGLAIVSGMNPLLAQAVFAAYMAASAVFAYAFPKVAQLALKLTEAVLGLAVTCVVGAAFTLGGILAGIGALMRTCCGNKQSYPNNDQPRFKVDIRSAPLQSSTQFSLSYLGRHPQHELASVLAKKNNFTSSHSESNLHRLSILADRKPQQQVLTLKGRHHVAESSQRLGKLTR